MGKDTVCALMIPAVLILMFLVSYKGGSHSSSSNPTIRRQQKKRKGNPIYIYALKDGRRRFYVGQTVSPQNRLRQHQMDADFFGTKKQKKIAWMNAKGRKPSMQILTKTKSKRRANSIEKDYIKKYGTHNTLHR